MLAVYSKEMKACSEEYYRDAIQWWKTTDEKEKKEEKANDGGKIISQRKPKGKITVNGKNVETDYEIKDGDRILHEMTRAETPVIESEIAIIENAPDFLVVNKPSSMPVHPCGNFKYNSLEGILENEMGY